MVTVNVVGLVLSDHAPFRQTPRPARLRHELLYPPRWKLLERIAVHGNDAGAVESFHRQIDRLARCIHELQLLHPEAARSPGQSLTGMQPGKRLGGPLRTAQRGRGSIRRTI